MEIGIDDNELDDEFYSSDEAIDDTTPQEYEDGDEQPYSAEDIINSLLESRGIEDSSKIKFENEDGEIEEVSWNDLDNESKLNILNSSEIDDNTRLDDDEINLINTIRQSQISPAEYLQYLQNSAVQQYASALQQQNMQFEVDQISNDELYVLDLMSRTGITQDEAVEQLDNAKSNEDLFNKQISALRNEYRSKEMELIQQDQYMQQQQAQAEYDRFAEKVESSIVNFQEFAGYDLNMTDENMEELYDLIVGRDPAGNSYLGKILSDPDSLVKMGWFLLYGEQMVQDMDNYYKKEIAKVRKESYAKGQQERDKTPIYFKNTNNTKSEYVDLDDF